MRLSKLSAVVFCVLSLPARAPHAAPPPLPLATENTRREISADKPLFLMMLDNTVTEDLLEDFWNLMPSDIRPYIAVWTPNTKLYDRLNERGIYFFSETHDPQYSAGDGLEELYRKYPYMIGNAHGEVAPNADFFKKAPQFVPRNLKLAKKYGGYTMWRIAGKSRVLPLIAEYWPGFAELARAHADHLILMNRNNGIGSTREGISEIIGAWQTGMVGHWGFDHQSFMWGFECGLNKLFGEETSPRFRPMSWLGLYPEAIFGMEMLESAALGATCFTWEYPCHLIYSPDMKRLDPEFRHVILPLLRKMLRERLIARKADVKAQMPVALLQPKTTGYRKLSGTFDGLYGLKYDDRSEWLPYTGRYLRVPILVDGLVGAEEKDLYKTVVDMTASGNPEALPWKNTLEKVAWFNRRYPAVGRGSAWYVRMGDRWYIANHWLNQNVQVDFELPLRKNTGAASVAGVFGPHTYATVQEQQDELKIHLNNYRVDKDVLFWKPEYKNAIGWFGGKYVEYLNANAADTADETLRETVFSVNGLDREPELLSITGGEKESAHAFQHVARWDERTRRYTIALQHNGPVDVNLGTKRCKRSGYPINLALFGTASASSSATVLAGSDRAIDGNDRSSRWEAGQPGEAWLEVAWRKQLQFDRVALKGYPDGITSSRIEYWNGTVWREFADGTAVTSDKVRAVVNGPNPSIYELEVYGEQRGMGLPHAATATDLYEPEEDAVLGNGAEKILAAAAGGLLVFNDGCVRLPQDGAPFVRFSVQAAEAGAYRLGLRYTRGESFGTGDGLLNVYVNGELARSMALPRTTKWGWWSGGASDVMNLHAGLNTVELRNDAGDGGACMIDFLSVTYLPECKQLPASAAMTENRPVLEGRRYQLENGALSGGAIIRNDRAGYSGTGCVFLAGKPGQAVSLKVQAEREGFHDIGIRYGLTKGREAVVTCHANGRKAYRFDWRNQGEPDLKGNIVADWNLDKRPFWLAKGGNELVVKVEPGDKGEALIDALVVATRPIEGFVAAARMDLDHSAAVAEGGWLRLAPRLDPNNPTVRGFAWESMNPAVATVSHRGTIKGVKPGKTTIVGRPLGGGPVSESCEVTVSGEIANIAPQATVTASAGEAKHAIDGVWVEEIGDDFRGVPFGSPGWLYGDITHAWTTTPNGSLAKTRKSPWLRLEWRKPHRIERVVLYPPAFANSWEEASLTTSAGGSVKLGPIDSADGSPLVIPLDPPVEADWIQLDILKQSTFTHAGNGIGEIEVDGK